MSKAKGFQDSCVTLLKIGQLLFLDVDSKKLSAKLYRCTAEDRPIFFNNFICEVCDHFVADTVTVFLQKVLFVGVEETS